MRSSDARARYHTLEYLRCLHPGEVGTIVATRTVPGGGTGGGDREFLVRSETLDVCWYRGEELELASLGHQPASLLLGSTEKGEGEKAHSELPHFDSAAYVAWFDAAQDGAALDGFLTTVEPEQEGAEAEGGAEVEGGADTWCSACECPVYDDEWQNLCHTCGIVVCDECARYTPVEFDGGECDHELEELPPEEGGCDEEAELLGGVVAAPLQTPNTLPHSTADTGEDAADGLTIDLDPSDTIDGTTDDADDAMHTQGWSAVPTVVDLVAQYEACTLRARACLQRCVASGEAFEDDEFPADSSMLFVEPQAPPPADWMGSPDLFERLPRMYAPHQVAVSTGADGADGLTQGEVSSAPAHGQVSA